MKKINVTMFRQGDVYLRRVEDVSLEGMHIVKPENGLLIVAYGEVTNHSHALPATDNVKLYRNTEGKMVIEVEEETQITHQEHAPITLIPGMYEAYIQEEYAAGQMRRVMD